MAVLECLLTRDGDGEVPTLGPPAVLLGRPVSVRRGLNDTRAGYGEVAAPVTADGVDEVPVVAPRQRVHAPLQCMGLARADPQGPVSDANDHRLRERHVVDTQDVVLGNHPDGQVRPSDQRRGVPGRRGGLVLLVHATPAQQALRGWLPRRLQAVLDHQPEQLARCVGDGIRDVDVVRPDLHGAADRVARTRPGGDGFTPLHGPRCGAGNAFPPPALWLTDARRKPQRPAADLDIKAPSVADPNAQGYRPRILGHERGERFRADGVAAHLRWRDRGAGLYPAVGHNHRRGLFQQLRVPQGEDVAPGLHVGCDIPDEQVRVGVGNHVRRRVGGEQLVEAVGVQQPPDALSPPARIRAVIHGELEGLVHELSGLNRLAVDAHTQERVVPTEPPGPVKTRLQAEPDLLTLRDCGEVEGYKLLAGRENALLRE